MNKNKIIGFGGAILGLVVITLLVVGGKSKRDAAQADRESKMEFQASARPVVTEKIETEMLTAVRSYPGIIKPSRKSDLSFRVGGPLIKADVLPGQPVKAGTVLMQIDPRDFHDRILSLEAAMAGAVAMSRNSTADFKRNSELFAEKVIPQSAMDRSRSAKDSASSAVQGLEAQLRMAQHSLEDTSLKAPYDGTVTKQLAENYEMIKAGQVVLKFQDTETLEVTINVPENEIAHRDMVPGSIAKLTFAALPGKRCEAKLKEWNSSADPITRTYAVTFIFEAPTTFRVLPGMTAEVTWTNKSEEGVSVPVSALLPAPNGESLVWIIEPASGKPEKREVTTGELLKASRVRITKGLQPGDQVIVGGSRLVHAGLTLKPTEG